VCGIQDNNLQYFL